MKYTPYKNFSFNSETEVGKLIINTNSERQFFFTQPKPIIDKFLYHQRANNKTSLASVQDGDPVIFFVNGDYTIPSGTTITQTNRCNGLYMFINGTLTNNGTISMTARGSCAEGRFVSIDVGNFINPNIRYDVENKFKECFEFIGNMTGTPTNNSILNGPSYRCCGSGGLGGLTNSSIASRHTQRIPGNGTSFSGGTGTGGSALESNES
jgi:hypothetical protein